MLLVLIVLRPCSSQDENYAHRIIEELSSPKFHGRGYVNNGDIMAGKYIAAAFKNKGLKAVGKSFLHPFDIAINVFPDTLVFRIDNDKMKPGKDYYVGGGSSGVRGTYELRHLDTADLQNAEALSKSLEGKVAVLPAIAERDERTYQLNAAGYIFAHQKKMYWRLSDATVAQPYFYIHTRDSLIDNADSIEIHIQNRFYEHYKTSNVMAMVEGSTRPDSFFVFTAHYDHLGRMGSEVVFPGANDNASGVAMLLELAGYYAKPANQPEYSIVFMAFAAEECGLYGSDFAASEGAVPLKRIRFLVNLDMVGTGGDGIGMVNAKVEPKADSIIRRINRNHHLFPDIRSGGARCVSDHCPWAQKGVPSVFIFTRGEAYEHYHTPADKGPVPLTKWRELFRLLTQFVQKY